jgi:ABC-type oligopeptide transport system substrate-binding subunit
MDGKLWLSLVAAVTGAGLLVAAGVATPTSRGMAQVGKHATAGGAFVAELPSDVVTMDPQLDYYAPGWELSYATACKLFNYQDKEGAAGSQVVPEVAAGFPTITNRGTTYLFTIRRGFRFNTGEAVTARSFADALNRAASPELQSGAQAFMDVIRGARAVIDGKARNISGLKATGNRLTIELTTASPDLLARLALPFFSAIDPATAANLDPAGFDTAPSCGPYYVTSRVPGKSITLKRNSFYTGPRPHNVNEIDLKIGNSQAVSEQDVSSGKADYAAGGIPAADWKALVDDYGVNKGRVYVKPTLSVYYVAMNDDRPLFKGNRALRQAVNWAIDRRALLNQEGYLAGRTTTQILPPGMPGYKNCKCYQRNVTPATLAKAKALAKGHTGDGKAILYSYGNTLSAELQAQIIQFNLKQIGLDVAVQIYSRDVQIEMSSARGAAFDLTAEGWSADYADPYDFINVLLSGDTLQRSNNSNVAYFDDPKYNKLMLAASRLVGKPRYAAYSALDVDITKKAAPWAAFRNAYNRDYVSARTACYTYNPVFEMDYAAICLK